MLHSGIVNDIVDVLDLGPLQCLLQLGRLWYLHLLHSGIVNDITVSLSVESLRLQHGFSDADEIILGFHPLEYLIFAKTAIDYQLPEHKQQPDKTNISKAKGTGDEQTTSATLTTGFERPDEDPIYRRRKLIQLLGDALEESVSAYLATRLEKVPYAKFVGEDQQQAALAIANLIEVARKNQFYVRTNIHKNNH